MRSDPERLADIVEAADKIRDRVARGREEFDAGEDLQIVLVHLVEVIGEAASRVSEKLRDRYPVVPWRQIVGMRNRVVHSYFEVDLDILWFVVSVDVPDLAPKVGAILADIARPEGKIDT